MNLRQFLDYRSTCPFCQGSLFTSFRPQSGRRQGQRYEEGRLVNIFDLDSANGNHVCKVGYSFGLDDSSFQVQFYDGEELEKKSITLSLLEKFVGLHANLKSFTFRKECRDKRCGRYYYGSQEFVLDLKGKELPQLTLHKERFGLIRQAQGCWRVMLLTNLHTQQQSIVRMLNREEKMEDTDSPAWALGNELPLREDDLLLPIIAFTSIEEVTKRVSNLVIFS